MRSAPRPATAPALSLRAFASAAPGEAASKEGSTAEEPPDAEPPAEVDRELMKKLFIIVGSQLLLNMGISQVVPVMPFFAAQIGGSLGATGVGLVLAMPSTAQALFNVPCGRLADTYGRLPLMCGGTIIGAAAMASLSYCNSIEQLLLLRFIFGAGQAAAMAGKSAYMADLTDRAPRHRARIMGFEGAAVGSVWIVGPMLGGALAETFGFRNSFLISGACAGLCVLSFAWLPETLKKAPDAGVAQPVRERLAAWWGDMQPLLKSRNQQSLLASTAGRTLGFSTSGSVIALHAQAAFGAGPGDIGMMMTAAAVSFALTMPVGSWFTERRAATPKKEIIFLGMSLASAGLFGASLASTSLEMCLAYVFIGGGTSLTSVASGTYAIEATRPDMRGQALSLHRMSADLVSLTSPVFLCLVADAAGCPSAMVLSATTLLGLSAFYLRFAGMPKYSGLKIPGN